MKQLSKRALLAGFVSMAFVATGCTGGSPEYTKDTACHVPADTMTKVVGTKNFEVKASSAQLPITPRTDDFRSFICKVKDGNDGLLTVIAKFKGDDYLELDTKTILGSPNHFSHLGGVGAPDDHGGAWVCGQITIEVIARKSIDPRPKPADMSELLRSLADEVGCWPDD